LITISLFVLFHLYYLVLAFELWWSMRARAIECVDDQCWTILKRSWTWRIFCLDAHGDDRWASHHFVGVVGHDALSF